MNKTMHSMKVLMVTSEWPTLIHPEWVPFLVEQVADLRRAGVTIEIFVFRGAMNPYNYLRAWYRLQRHLQKEPWDLIHAQFGQAGLLGIWPKHAPLVVTYHGSDLNGFTGTNGRISLKGHILRRISQLVALRSDEIILVSEKLSKYLPQKRYRVIPCGIDLEMFKPIPQVEARKQLGLPLGQKLILFTSAPTNPIKRYALAQEAVARLNGFGKLLAVSNVPHDQMPLFFNATDVLLLTSTREGSPTVVKEALACNLPVVSVDVGDVRQRIENLEGCLVCEDDHPDTIATNLRYVLTRQQPSDTRAAVLDLDGKLIAQRIIDVYHKVISDRRYPNLATVKSI